MNLLPTVGHGRSEGYRADISSFSEYTQSVLQHVQLMKEKYPDLPVFILGHSLVCISRCNGQVYIGMHV